MPEEESPTERFNQPKTSSDAGTESSEHASHAEPEVSDTLASVQANSQKPPYHCEITCKKEKDWWDKAKPFVEIVGIVLLLAYTITTIAIWCATRNQVKASQDANKLQARIAAYDRGATMNPCWLTILQEKPNAVRYDLSVWNIGNGRAYNVRIFQEGEFRESEPPDVSDPKEKSVFLDEFAFGTPHPDSTFKTHCPDDSYLPSYISPPPGYRERKLRLYTHGTIWYTDFSPQSHFVQFCLSVLPGDPKHVALCGTHRLRGDEQ